MKRITKRIQQLGQRAEQLREIAHQMPGRAEGLRRSMISATEKLQQVRADLMVSAAALRGQADTDSVGLLTEIGEVGELLDGSGFMLEGVDWDIGAARRLQVRLERLAPTTVKALRSLLAKYDDKPAARTILTALIQAQEAAEEIEVGSLLWTDVVIEIGAVTTVRIGWHQLVEEEDEVEASRRPGSGAGTSEVPRASSISSPAFTSGFFQRPMSSAPTHQESSSPGLPITPPTLPEIDPIAVEPPPLPTRTPTWGTERGDTMSLDRFKKMPNVGRRSR